MKPSSVLHRETKALALASLSAALLASVFTVAYAQPPAGPGAGAFPGFGAAAAPLTIDAVKNGVPNLTAEQIAAITPLLKEIADKQAEVTALRTAATTQQATINDRISVILNDAQKAAFAQLTAAPGRGAGGFPGGGFPGGAPAGGGFPGGGGMPAGFGGGAPGGGGAPAAFAFPATKEAGANWILYVSHSLMWDVPAIFTEHAKASDIKGHLIVGVQRNGFSTTLQMWNGGAQSKAALETGKVDVFITSPMEMPDEGVDKFVEYGLKYNSKTKFYVQNNWAGFNMDGNLAHSAMGRGRKDWDESTVEDLKTLNTVCEKAFEDQVKLINEKYRKDPAVGHDVIWIIPTSQANTVLRTKIIQKAFAGLDKQSDLFADQIGHPKAPLWALNAYIHYATIYGKSPVGLPIPTVLTSTNNPKFDADFNKRLQELAWETVTSYPFSGVKAPAKP